MKKEFDIEKTLACIAYICKNSQGEECRAIDLIKAMYFAERESIIRTFHKMTGDAMMCYKNGPILKTIHDMTRGNAGALQKEWDSLFNVRKIGKYNMISLKEGAIANMDRLSIADEAFLNRGIGFIDSCRGKSVVHETHKSANCREWVKARDEGKKEISLEYILLRYRKDLKKSQIRELLAK